MNINKSLLGKKTKFYSKKYNSDILFAIPRLVNRKKLNISDKTIFIGCDIWTAYETSWLNMKGKPEIAIVQIIIPANSKNIIESKSLKLYLNSFNQKNLENNLKEILINDISKITESEIFVNIIKPDKFLETVKIQEFNGICLDNLDINTDIYLPNNRILKNTNSDTIITERLFSNLLKSNCPVTNQPDWGSIQIDYTGKPIDHESIIKYIISYRNHSDFHENCIERIFIDIKTRCNPEKLSVYGRYTRRGGIDINPWRSNVEHLPTTFFRVSRQ